MDFTKVNSTDTVGIHPEHMVEGTEIIHRNQKWEVIEVMADKSAGLVQRGSEIALVVPVNINRK